MNNNEMKRGRLQALYKYLPGSWVDFAPSGGSSSYVVRVDAWNSDRLTKINSKRLLRVVSQRVQEYKRTSTNPRSAVKGFAEEINEDTYEVLQPKISSNGTYAIRTLVNPLVFVCNSCGRMKQFRSYDDFRRNERVPCQCGGHMTQYRIIRYCECGYADGNSIPRCNTPGHGSSYITRRGSGFSFVCSKCGREAQLNWICPNCHAQLKIKNAQDSAHFLPFTFSIIDLRDRRKDVFIDNETNCQGEKVVLAQYLGKIDQELYEDIVARGSIVLDEEFEESLRKEARDLRNAGLDEATIEAVLDAKRRVNPNSRLYEAVAEVGNSLSSKSGEYFTLLTEQVLEYDELVKVWTTLELEQAADDAERLNDGLRPEYRALAGSMGFSDVRLCSEVPVVAAAYGYTRNAVRGDSVTLCGFPKEGIKHNVYAVRAETEGVLFELDRGKLIGWLAENGFIATGDMPLLDDDYGRRLWFLDKVRPELIRPFDNIDENCDGGPITAAVYKLIHSLSHALIIEASEICGLDRSSLSEYILPNIPAVFIYCSNSQGYNMGALQSAFQGYFDKWLNRARKNSEKCIFDPVCIDRDKACVGCLFLNEVSCQHYNKDLDRGYLCGYFAMQNKKKLTGFWEV